MPEPLKVKAPSFYGRTGSSVPKTAASGSNLKKHWPIIGALVLLGVAVIFFLRSKSLSSSANVGPALSIYPDTSADSSGLANALQGLQALGNIQRGAGNGGDTVTTLPVGQPIPFPDNQNNSPGSTPIVNNTGGDYSGYVPNKANYPGLSDATLAYWESKFGGDNSPNAFNPNNTYDPATLYARWQAIASGRDPNAGSYSPQDIAIGLAAATKSAQAAGVTGAQIDAAEANIAKYGPYAGYSDPVAAGYVMAKGATVGIPYTKEQISYANARGLSAQTAESVSQLLADPNFVKLGTPTFQKAAGK